MTTFAQTRPVQGKLIRQVTLPVLLGLFQLGLALLDILSTPVTPSTLLWLLASFAVGFAFGCAIRVAWDREASQVVLAGGQLLLTLAFILVNLGSKAILNHALDDRAPVSVIVLLVGSGLLVGHAAGLTHQIRRALPR
jgi:hypothetical protein